MARNDCSSLYIDLIWAWLHKTFYMTKLVMFTYYKHFNTVGFETVYGDFL